MQGYNLAIANLTLFVGAGTLIVGGSICALSSQVQTWIDFVKNRVRQRQSL